MRFGRQHVIALTLLTVCREGAEPGKELRVVATGDVVVAWSEKAYQVAFASDSFRTFQGQRAFAMMHLAMHDAVNAVAPRYQQFVFKGRDSEADATVAAAQAAHDVLAAQYPGSTPELDTELARSVNNARAGSAAARGVAVGKAAAAAIIASRESDGWDSPGTYTFRDTIGAYRTTPPWSGFVLQPGFRAAKAFALTSPSQFHADAPPRLTSAEYAQAFNEVKSSGAANSSTRSADQSAYAVWWMEFAEASVARLARRLATERQLDLATAARLFALLSVSIYDSYIGVWEAKYTFNHWRPYTAIREAAHDDNDGTEPDAAWEAMRPAPPFPEYVSAHAAGCGAAFHVLEQVFGNSVPFTMQTNTAPEGMPTRTFATFDAAATECADSRVRLGWHFRYSTDAGLALGRSVAAWVAAEHLREVP